MGDVNKINALTICVSKITGEGIWTNEIQNIIPDERVEFGQLGSRESRQMSRRISETNRISEEEDKEFSCQVSPLEREGPIFSGPLKRSSAKKTSVFRPVLRSNQFDYAHPFRERFLFRREADLSASCSLYECEEFGANLETQSFYKSSGVVIYLISSIFLVILTSLIAYFQQISGFWVTVTLFLFCPLILIGSAMLIFFAWTSEI